LIWGWVAVAFKKAEPKRRAGRQRSLTLDSDILEAALNLLAEVGPVRLSVDQIAKEVGCSRTTVYRRWPSLESLLLDALAKLLGELDASMPTDPVSGDALRSVVRGHVLYQNDRRVPPLAAVIGAETSRQTELGRRFLDEVFMPSRARDAAALRKGVERHEIRADTDVDLLLDVVTGTMLFRETFGPRPDADLGERLLDLLVRGVGPCSNKETDRLPGRAAVSDPAR
jgi:AcrR family transcriptional regulator